MRINVAISDKLLEKVDERAEALCISRSAYISMALSQKLQSDAMMEDLPNMLSVFKDAIQLERERQASNPTSCNDCANPCKDEVDPAQMAICPEFTPLKK